MRSSSSVTIVAISTIWSRVWSRPVISRSIHTNTGTEPSGTVATRLRREPFDEPTVSVAPVADSIVQPARPALPELGRLDDQPPAAPERRTRHVATGEALRCTSARRRSSSARSASTSLCGDAQAARLTLSWPAGEVVIALVVVDTLDVAPQADLAVQLEPGEDGGGVRVGVELAALGAAVVGEEHDGAVVGAAGQHVRASG